MKPFTLMDLQNEMFRMSLHTTLTPTLWQFFWGLIMTANSIKPRFRNPFDLTVNQSISAGGGNSRQAVWGKQQKLKEVTIDGQYLVEIVNGDKQKNIPATYLINYNLILPAKYQSTEIDATATDLPDQSTDQSIGFDATATDPLTDQQKQSTDQSTNVDHPKSRSEEESKEEKLRIPKNISSDLEINPDLTDSLNLESALQTKWNGVVNINQNDLGKVLTAIKVSANNDYAPLTFWFAVMNRMSRPPKTANSIIKYGKTMWNDYRKKNNIQVWI